MLIEIEKERRNVNDEKGPKEQIEVKDELGFSIEIPERISIFQPSLSLRSWCEGNGDGNFPFFSPSHKELGEEGKKCR